MKQTLHRGFLMITAIVFGAVFIAVFGGLSMFVLSENKLQTKNEDLAEAFSLAEAGLEYYRWFLAHFPNDVQNGTGVAGPYVIPYNDPEGGVAGTITLAINGNTSCGQLTSIDITSTGSPADAPTVSRTLTARYARPSVGTFSYILNSSVWAGADRVILGPYHSNGGIRMDGTSNSPVTSSLSTWNCTSTYGCGDGQSSGEIGNPSAGTKTGVFGGGPNQDLWEYPVPQVNFGDIAADFTALKTTAQASGIYYPRYSTTTNSSNASYWNGYHLIFNSNGTVTVRRVNSTTQLNAVLVSTSANSTDRALIQNEANYETRTIPATCGLIFVEDNVWVEGTIPSKITLVAANVVNGGTITPNAYLVNNIQYSATDGSDGLTLIASRNVLIAPNSPFNMTLNGIFVAQSGYFGRNLYSCSSAYEPKGTLTILGTTVSSLRTGTKWIGACGNYGGYGTRIDSYDRRIASDPPPFTPTVSDDFEFQDWREE